MSASSAGARGPLRARSRAVWAVVALGGLTLATAVPTWLTTTVSTALTATVPVEVTGTDAASAVGAAALVVVAGGVALAIAGRVARWVAAVVVALAGVLIAGTAAGVLRDPVPAATAGASDAQGVTDLTSPVAVAPWPWLTAVLGVLVVVAAVLVVLGGPAWGATSGRHERAGAPADGPADDAPPSSGSDGTGVVGTPAGGAASPHDPHDAWDALTRGTDPSDER